MAEFVFQGDPGLGGECGTGRRDEAGGRRWIRGPEERRKPKAGDDGPGRRAVMS